MPAPAIKALALIAHFTLNHPAPGLPIEEQSASAEITQNAPQLLTLNTWKILEIPETTSTTSASGRIKASVKMAKMLDKKHLFANHETLYLTDSSQANAMKVSGSKPQSGTYVAISRNGSFSSGRINNNPSPVDVSEYEAAVFENNNTIDVLITHKNASVGADSWDFSMTSQTEHYSFPVLSKHNAGPYVLATPQWTLMLENANPR